MAAITPELAVGVEAGVVSVGAGVSAAGAAASVAGAAPSVAGVSAAVTAASTAGVSAAAISPSAAGASATGVATSAAGVSAVASVAGAKDANTPVVAPAVNVPAVWLAPSLSVDADSSAVPLLVSLAAVVCTDAERPAIALITPAVGAADTFAIVAPEITTQTIPQSKARTARFFINPPK